VEALVLIEDQALRDVVAVGLRNVPGCKADCPTSAADPARAKRRAFDAIFTDHDPNKDPGLTRLTRLRDAAPNAEIIVVAEKRIVESLATDRSRLRLGAFLEVPLDLREFFKVGMRLAKRTRRLDH
jgi:DNA-binding NtrC family response regulator